MKSLKHPVICGCAAFGLAAAFLSPPSSIGQAAEDPATANARIAALISEISAQQTQILANQTATDQKISQIEEIIRQAKMFVSRGGGAGGSR